MPDPNKLTVPDHPILDCLSQRYSPYAFEPRPIENDKLLSLLEAARWAASSFNEQPWRFILATRDDIAAWRAALGCLVEANQQWAQNAGALIFTIAKSTFTYNDAPNRVAEHDIGLAIGNLNAQATALGLHAHQMAGIDLDAVRRAYDVPEGFEPVTAIAVGYAADAEPDDKPRARKPLSEWVYAGKFGQTSPIV